MDTEEMAMADTKDWTWVLERPCPECGLESATVDGAQIPEVLADVASRWTEVLTRADVEVRPAAEVWSPLEYACHVRDVCTVMAGRARRMLAEDSPTFPDWDQDAAAQADRYAEQDPVDVARELAAAADDAAGVFAGVSGAAWDRPGLRSNGSSFTVRTLGQYFVHDVIHHLHDVAG